MDGIGQGIGEALGCLYVLAIAGLIAIVALIGVGGYEGYQYFFAETRSFESHDLLKPSIKLHTDGKAIDTIYVYTIKVNQNGFLRRASSSPELK